MAEIRPPCPCLDPVALGHTERSCPDTMVPWGDMPRGSAWQAAPLVLERLPCEPGLAGLPPPYIIAASARGDQDG